MLNLRRAEACAALPPPCCSAVLRPPQVGTITHMPAELLVQGKMSPAGDVYAFGMISESPTNISQHSTKVHCQEDLLRLRLFWHDQ